MEIDDPALIAYLKYLFKEAYDEYSRIGLTEAEYKSIVFNKGINLQTTSGSRKCSVNYCRNKAVMSHLFQESILKKISSNGHLLSPSVNFHERKVELRRVGTSKAFVFPGFCSTHENMFEYEKAETIKHHQEIRTLIYKSACYNHVFWDTTCKAMKNGFDKARAKKQTRFTEMSRKKYSKALGGEVKFGFEEQYGGREKEMIRNGNRLISEALNFKKLIWNDIKDRESKRVKIFQMTITEVIPICFSYIGQLSLSNGVKKHSLPACFIIHPFKSSTHLIFSSHAETFEELVGILKEFTPEQVWTFILTSLVYVSDNWLINPDFYDDYYPPSLKQLIATAPGLPLAVNFENV